KASAWGGRSQQKSQTPQWPTAPSRRGDEGVRQETSLLMVATDADDDAEMHDAPPDGNGRKTGERVRQSSRRNRNLPLGRGAGDGVDHAIPRRAAAAQGQRREEPGYPYPGAELPRLHRDRSQAAAPSGSSQKREAAAEQVEHDVAL